MKTNLKQFLIALCLLVAPLGIEAQSLVFHLAGGNKTTVTLPATFTVTPTGSKLVITVEGSDNVELSKDNIMCVTYRDAKGDVNSDGQVDVADITTLVALLIGKDNTEEQAYLTCPDDHHPHMIDLGLPSGTKWACCNVGASKPEGYGSYYRWGETSPLVLGETPVEYPYDGGVLGDNIAGTQYDAATASWGAPWKMPTNDQINELLEKCTSTWTTQNGVNGRMFTGSNGMKIFLPAAGILRGELYGVGTGGVCWSSTSHYENSPYSLSFASDYAALYINDLSYGRSVRPVR